MPENTKKKAFEEINVALPDSSDVSPKKKELVDGLPFKKIEKGLSKNAKSPNPFWQAVINNDLN